MLLNHDRANDCSTQALLLSNASAPRLGASLEGTTQLSLQAMMDRVLQERQRRGISLPGMNSASVISSSAELLINGMAQLGLSDHALIDHAAMSLRNQVEG